MENLNEKKWFVYMGDHHEGPFSATEIQTKITNGIVDTSSYVWKEGMADWQPMAQVTELTETSAQPATPQPDPAASPQPTVTNIEPGQPSEFTETQNQPYGNMETTVGLGSDAATGPIDTGSDLLEVDSGGPEIAQTMIAEAAPLEHPFGDPNANAEAAPAAQAGAGEFPMEAVPDDTLSQVAPAQPFEEDEMSVSVQTPANTSGPDDMAKNAFPPGEMARAQSMSYQQGGASADWQLDTDDKKYAGKRRRKLLLLLILIIGAGGYYLGFFDEYLGNTPVPGTPQTQEQAGFGAKIKKMIQPIFGSIAAKIPMVGDLVSPVPSIDGVSERDLGNLRAAAATPIAEKGPKISVAVSTVTPNQPVVHIASNMPDGMKISVFLKGLPDTLLRSFDYRAYKEVTLMNNYATVTTFSDVNPKALPPGQYMVYATEALQQPDAVMQILSTRRPSALQLPADLGTRRKIVDYKSYFMGGEKNEVYRSELKKYHFELQGKSKAELEELLQFATTIKERFDTSVRQFDRLSRGRKTRTRVGVWRAFDRKWQTMFNQMNSEIGKWTPQYIQANFFHSSLYQMLASSANNVRVVHQNHTQYFNTKGGSSSADLQVNEARTKTQNELTTLIARIKKSQELGTTPNGMPKRDQE